MGPPLVKPDGRARATGREPEDAVQCWRIAAARGILTGVDSVVSFLIAEDDELVGRILVRALSEHGRTELVTSVEEARTALKTGSFTAVVVDVGLPDGSGLDVINDARA